jgi:hypothetical protein
VSGKYTVPTGDTTPNILVSTFLSVDGKIPIGGSIGGSYSAWSGTFDMPVFLLANAGKGASETRFVIVRLSTYPNGTNKESEPVMMKEVAIPWEFTFK